MLVLASILSICAAAVAFLLRFLYALESDVRSHGKRSVRLERIRTHRVPSRTEVRGPVPALTLVHSNSRLASQARLGAPGAGLRAVETSHIKEA
jgi:hypothetical protein